MKVVCWMLPVKRHKLDKVRSAMAAIEGELRADFVDSERRCGIEREMWFLWETPEQAYCVVFMQADDLEAGLKRFAAANEPYEVEARMGNDDLFEYWPDPAWGNFPTRGVLELLSAYDAHDPSLNAQVGS